MDSIIIRLIDMPEAIHGVTRKDAEGDYNIYINAKLSADGRAEALRHEVAHILRGHFYDDCKTVEQMEREAAEDGNAKENKIGKVASNIVSWS